MEVAFKKDYREILDRWRWEVMKPEFFLEFFFFFYEEIFFFI